MVIIVELSSYLQIAQDSSSWELKKVQNPNVNEANFYKPSDRDKLLP